MLDSLLQENVIVFTIFDKDINRNASYLETICLLPKWSPSLIPPIKRVQTLPVSESKYWNIKQTETRWFWMWEDQEHDNQFHRQISKQISDWKGKVCKFVKEYNLPGTWISDNLKNTWFIYVRCILETSAVVWYSSLAKSRTGSEGTFYV